MQLKHWGDFADDPLSQNRSMFEHFPENMEPLEKKSVRYFTVLTAYFLNEYSISVRNWS